MKITEIRELTDEELVMELARLRRHLFDLRSQAVTEKLENPAILTAAKRDIARILTLQSEREIASERSDESDSTRGTSGTSE